MFKYYHLSVFLILFSCFACTTEEVVHTDILKYRSEVITLPIDYSIFPNTSYMQYMDGALYWMSKDKRTVHQLDFKKKKFDLILKFQEEGPNGLGMPFGFYMHSLDSIYFPSNHRLFLVDRQAEVLKSYDFSDFDLIGPLISQARYSKPFVGFSQGIVVGLNPGLVAKNLLSKDFLNGYNPFLIFNPRSEKIEVLNFKLDPSIFNDGPNLISSSYAGEGNDLFVITRYSNILHKYNVKTTETSIHELESKLVRNFSDQYFRSDPRNNSIDKNTRLIYNHSSNIGLLYDPYRNLVYRMGWKGEEIEKNLNMMKYTEFLPHFVVGVYDATSLELLAEFDLPRNKYLAHHYFVSEDGLNLFLNHPDDPDSKEDEITIEVFDFSGLR